MEAGLGLNAFQFIRHQFFVNLCEITDMNYGIQIPSLLHLFNRGEGDSLNTLVELLLL